MSIETKANIGDRIYFIRQLKRVPCPICQGKGQIQLGRPVSFDVDAPDVGEQFMKAMIEQSLDCLSGKFNTYTCPECKGKGTVKATGQTKYQVVSGLVNRIAAVAGENGTANTYYFNAEDGGGFTATDETLYVDKDKAEYDCRVRNLERKIVNINHIGVTAAFASTQPCNTKLNKWLDEYRRSGKFDTEIYVTEKGVLFDGYTAYLVYKMFGVENVPVVIWPDDMLDEKKLKPKAVDHGN